MKSAIIRPALLIAVLAGLAACGGKAMFTVGGTIQAPEYPGLVLSSGGNDLAIAAHQTTFAFPQQIEYGAAYTVSIKSQPAHSSCALGQGVINNTITTAATDTAGRLATINVGVFCNLLTHHLGGTITGLGSAEGLVLANGSLGGTVTVLKDSVIFTFANSVAYGQSYGVTILKQPTGKTCTVTDGVGQMADVDIASVKVNCV
jgi:hypothetical protein